MLRIAKVVLLLSVALSVVQALPTTRMVLKIRPVGRAVDLLPVDVVPSSSGFTHIPVEDPEVGPVANFATAALSFTIGDNADPLKLVKTSSVSKRTDQLEDVIDYKLTLILQGNNEVLYYCNAAIQERVTSRTKSSSHREVHMIQPSHCIRGPQELVLAEEDGIHHLPAALYAATELTKSVLVLNSSLTLVKVAQWMPTERQFGNEYVLNLVLANADGDGELHCHAEVNDRISHGDKKMINVDCSPSAVAPSGSVVDDADVLEVAEFVTHFLQETRDLNQLRLLRVESAEKRPFDGLKIKLTLTLSSTSADEEEVMNSCNVAVFQDSHTNDYEMIRSNTTCTNTPSSTSDTTESPMTTSATESAMTISETESPTTTSATESPMTTSATPDTTTPVTTEEPTAVIAAVELEQTAPVTEGYLAVPVDDTQVEETAVFAAGALTRSLGSDEHLTLVRIVSAQLQQVPSEAATNYRLVLEMESSEEPLFCQVIVFDQPETGTRELSDIGCTPGPIRLEDEEQPSTTTS